MRKIILFLLTLGPLVAQAEHTDTTGAVTFINLNQKLSSYSSLTYYHYDVWNFERKKFKGQDFQAGDAVTYFQFAYNYQYLPDLALSLGYIFQESNPFEEDDFQNENRIFEQVTIADRRRDFTATHRFRFEQRFIDNRSHHATYMRTRLRYQIGAKVPLRGLSLDPGEYFLNAYNEFYFSTTGNRNAFYSDNWLYAGLGKQLKGWGTVEIGPMVQYSVIDQDKNTRYHYVVMAGWSYSF